MAESALIHVQHKLTRRVQAGLVLGQLGDLVAKLVDHPLIKIDRFRPLLARTCPAAFLKRFSAGSLESG